MKCSEIFNDISNMYKSNDNELLHLGLSLTFAYKFLIRTSKGSSNYQKDIFTIQKKEVKIVGNKLHTNFLYGKSHMHRLSYDLNHEELIAFKTIYDNKEENDFLFPAMKLLMRQYLYSKYSICLPGARKASISIHYTAIKNELRLNGLHGSELLSAAQTILATLTVHKTSGYRSNIYVNMLNYIDPDIYHVEHSNLYEIIPQTKFVELK